MNKLMLNKGKAMACLILMCLFLAQGCRKDRLQSKTVENENQLIKEDIIDNWIKNNPASKYLNLDWSKAKQAIIDGKQVVRIPLLPPSKNTTAKLSLSSTLSQAKLSTVSTGLGIVGKTAVNNTDDNNTNYNRLHAPEVFFIQEGNNEKLHAFLINFVVSDTEHDFGDNGIWTGKLYEWNVTADTIFVQKMVRSHLREKYLLKYSGNTPEGPGGIESAPKNIKLQSLTGVGNRKTSNVFTWILDKLEDAIGWFGDLFGLSYWSGSNIYGQTAEDAGYRISPINWKFLTGGGSGQGSGSASGSYVGAGMGIYGSYIQGYQGNMDLGLNYGTSTPGNIVYTNYPNNQHGPNPPTQSVSEAPNADGIHVLEFLTVSPATQDYILTIPAVPLAKMLREYLADHNYTNESRAFASWAAEYITENQNLSFTEFQNQFTSPTDVIADPSGDNWADIDNEVLFDSDQTNYQQYQDTDPWPTVDRVIPFQNFVPNRIDASGHDVNCLILAKEQLGKAGYTCSGYLPGIQTFQVYKELTGVDLGVTKKAISYIISSLGKKIPVLIGVDNRVGTPSAKNVDKSTDHFVVIVAMGIDEKGKYFQFMDSSTMIPATGASFSNRLYYNASTGKITGKTANVRYRSFPGMHDYIITQVRKSIKN